MIPTSLAAAIVVLSTFITPSIPGPAPAAPFEIPAACEADGTMRIQVAVEASEPRSFVLDTGSSVSFVDAQVAAALQLTPAGRIASARGFWPLVHANLSVGDRALPPMTIVSDDRSKLRGMVGKSDAGIIGNDVVRALGRVTIDYARCRLSVGESGPQRRGAGRVPLSWHEGRPIVEIPGGGRLLLDSGASMLTVFEGTRAASTFRYATTPSLVRLRHITGDVVGRVGLLPSLTLGTLELTNVPTLGAKSWYGNDQGAPDGLLPLALFGRVHINAGEAYAVLEARR